MVWITPNSNRLGARCGCWWRGGSPRWRGSGWRRRAPLGAFSLVRKRLYRSFLVVLSGVCCVDNETMARTIILLPQERDYDVFAREFGKNHGHLAATEGKATGDWRFGGLLLLKIATTPGIFPAGFARSAVARIFVPLAATRWILTQAGHIRTKKLSLMKEGEHFAGGGKHRPKIAMARH